MSPNAPAGPDDFREQLSAWHDGALRDEASRFVLKRLLQDEALRAEVGRWQAMGDALRRASQQPTATDLPVRVAAALSADAGRSASSPRANPAARWIAAGRWMASAAAVGMAAVLFWPSAPDVGNEPALASTMRASPAAAPARMASWPVPMRVEASLSASTPEISVPPLVRAPQPTPEQLAPLPAVDAPGRPWPRSAPHDAAYTVDYGVPPVEPSRE